MKTTFHFQGWFIRLTDRFVAVRTLRTVALSLLIGAVALVASGCQSANPPGPTQIPTVTATLTPSQTPAGPASPEPSLRPIVTATAIAMGGPTAGPVQDQATAVPTVGPYCYTVGNGDTLLSLITKAGYRTLDVLDEVRQLNNLGASNAIQLGQQICIPRQTATPTPAGFDATQTKQAEELGAQSGPRNFTIITIKVVDGDNIMTLQVRSGATLREICELNNPDPINCGGCKLDAPIGQQECRPILRLGADIKIPGPTPTPTITPTLTGSETTTPTPQYPGPRLVSPVNGDKQQGLVQLVWLPAGILQPDESYLVLLTDTTTGKTYEFETGATSYRLPQNIQPTDQDHRINWQVVISRKGADGTYVMVGNASLIYTFVWQPSS